MPISRVGLKQIVACDAGTLTATPANPIAMGIRLGATLKESAYKPVTDSLNRNWRNKINFNLEAETLQPTMHLLDKSIDWLNGNVDVQALPRKQTRTGGQNECYKFINDGNGKRRPGLDFEAVLSGDKRSIKHTYEIALPYDKAKTIISDSGTPVDFAPGIVGAGEDQAKFRRPFYIAFEAPKTTLLATPEEIVSRSLTISTKNKKQEEANISIVDFLTVELELKTRNASFAERLATMNKDNSPSVYIKEQNNGAFFDAFDFATGVLTLDNEFEISDEDRVQTLKFTGDIFIYDFEFLFGATYGGDAGDTKGEKGGTMRAGY